MKSLLNLLIVGLVVRAAFIWMQDQTTPHSTVEHSNPDQDIVPLTNDEIWWITEWNTR